MQEYLLGAVSNDNNSTKYKVDRCDRKKEMQLMKDVVQLQVNEFNCSL